MIIDKEFNKDRSRAYGKRIGDIVYNRLIGECEVIGCFSMDNNRLLLRKQSGEEIDFVAEWLDIVKKVE